MVLREQFLKDSPSMVAACVSCMASHAKGSVISGCGRLRMNVGVDGGVNFLACEKKINGARLLLVSLSGPWVSGVPYVHVG